MLSPLNPASAAAAAAQAPAFAARGDNAADGGAEFAKALEQSNSSWKNQAPAESTARSAAPPPHSQGPDGSMAPAARDTAHPPRPEAGAQRSDGDTAGTARSPAAAGSDEAGAEATSAGTRPGRAGQRRGTADTRPAGPAPRQRSEPQGARHGIDAGDGKAAASEDKSEPALDEDISLAAGLMPPPQAIASPAEPTAPGMPALTQVPGADGQPAAQAGDAGAAADPDTVGLLANDAAPRRGAGSGIATTALASSYRRLAGTDASAASGPPLAAPVGSALMGSAAGAEQPASPGTAEADLRSTAAPAKALHDGNGKAPRTGPGASDDKPGDAATLAAALGGSGGRISSPASDAGNDRRSTAADSRVTRGANEASALANAPIASAGTRGQGDEGSGHRSDTQGGNGATGLANAAAGTVGGAGSSGARFAEQLQSLLPAMAAGAPAALPMASAAAAPVPTAQLSPSLYSPDFAPAMGAQVTLFARDGVHHARIELNPAEMGPISVQIEMKGSGARVDFQAEQAGTRQVIESSLPALASALRDAGMTLTGGGVFQPDGSQAAAQNGSAFGNPAGGNPGGPDNGQPRGGHGQPGHAGRAADDGGPAGSASTVRLAAAQRGLVDLVA